MKRPLLRIAVLAALAAVWTSAFARSADLNPSETRQLAIPRVQTAPRIEDFLDMAPDAAMKGKMAKLDHLVQRRPKDGAPASQKTEVYLGYDARNLYVVFICFDNEPGSIRAHIGRREDVFEDDYAGIALDTFRDQRHSYFFAVNPYGVQVDGILAEGQSDD